MERKQDGFVPIGDVADGLSLPGGRALTPHAATPQARRHFTTLHQVNQLIEASEADADLGFMAPLLALCSVPRTDPKNRLVSTADRGEPAGHQERTRSTNGDRRTQPATFRGERHTLKLVNQY